MVASDVFTFNVGFGISIAAPALVSPDHGSVESVRPTLRIERARYTGTVATMFYRFQIASTPAFDRVVLNTGSGDFDRTAPIAVSVQQGAELEPSTTYYWRASAYDTRTLIAGPYSATGTFATRAVGLQPPAALSPSADEPTTLRPTLVVKNAPHVGPVGIIAYRFDLATDIGFSSIIDLRANDQPRPGVHSAAIAPNGDRRHLRWLCPGRPSVVWYARRHLRRTVPLVYRSSHSRNLDGGGLDRSANAAFFAVPSVTGRPEGLHYFPRWFQRAFQNVVWAHTAASRSAALRLR